MTDQVTPRSLPVCETAVDETVVPYDLRVSAEPPLMTLYTVKGIVTLTLWPFADAVR